MTTEQKIKVMKAYIDGKQIQYFSRSTFDWQDCKAVPIWDWVHYSYRIKPEEEQIDETVPEDMPGLLTPKQTAELLGLTVRALYLRVYRGTIPVVRLGTNGSSLRFDPEEIQKFINDHRTPAYGV